MRNIEQAARTKYAPRTFTQLEQALDWPPGIVEKILGGTATPSEMNEVVVRDDAAVRRGTASAQLGGLTATTTGQVNKPEIRAEDEPRIFSLASQLVPLLVNRSPSSPAARAAVTNLLDVMREMVEPTYPDAEE